MSSLLSILNPRQVSLNRVKEKKIILLSPSEKCSLLFECPFIEVSKKNLIVYLCLYVQFTMYTLFATLFYYALKKCPFLVHVHVRDHVYIANCNIARKSKKREMKKEKYVWNLLYKKIVSDDVICVLYLFPIY